MESLKHIVFAGGGVRGISYTGALMAFEDTFKVSASKHFESYAGSSVGSLYAMICALDLDVSSVPKVLSGTSSGLGDIFVKDPTWLLSNYALNSGEALKEIVLQLLTMGSCDANTTFSSLYQKTKKRLMITVVDILSARVIYLDHTNEGSDMPILTAIMGSMALPPLFPPVSWNKKLLLVDGGLLNNFPVDQYPSGETLGLKTSWYISPGNPLTDIASYYSRLLSILLIPIHKIQEEKKDDLLKTIHIDLGNIKADAPDVDVQKLIFSGYRNAISTFTHSCETIHENPTKYLT